jgi:hypothetical protein
MNYVALKDPTLCVDLELYTSIWAQRSEPLFHAYGFDFDKTLQLIAASKKHPSPFPQTVRNVIIAVSAAASAARELVAWRGLSGSAWSFELVKNVNGPPQMRVLRWTKPMDADENDA